MDWLGKSSMKSSSVFQKCLHSFLLRKMTQLWLYRWFPKVSDREQTWARSAEDAVTFTVLSFLWLQVDGTDDENGTRVGTTPLLMGNLADADEEGGTFLPAGIGETLTPFWVATGSEGWGCSKWNWFPTVNDNPLPYSCLGNTMDRRAWWATVHGVATSMHAAKSNPMLHSPWKTREWLSGVGLCLWKLSVPLWACWCDCKSVCVEECLFPQELFPTHTARYTCQGFVKKKKISSPLLTVCTVTHSSLTQLFLEMWIIFSLLGWRWGRRQMAQLLTS